MGAMGSSFLLGAAWKLSITCALSQAACMVICISAVIGVVVANHIHDVDTYPSRMDVGLARIGCVIFTASGLLAYLHVGLKASRPRQLHMHGLVLSLMVPESCLNILGKEIADDTAATAMSMAAANFIFGLRKAILYRLVLQKLAALATGQQCCLKDVSLWGRLLVASIVMVSILGLTLVAVRVSRAAMRSLLERQVAFEELAKVRRTLRLHVLGVLLSIVSTFLLFVGVGLDFAHDFEGTNLSGATYVADSAGDVVGIMLLSGIGVLLFREDPEAGDVDGQMRSLLHSAVLSSRADVVFEGHISSTRGQACVVSFPGQFLPEWHSLTWLCEQDRLSSACVFLPRSDPENRFGQHSSCPDLPGKCWCHHLYGTEKPWGCLWFTKWRGNVEKAVAEGLQLVVVFFPDQTGQGIVEWSHLSTADLWDGIGLGGSQKAEVAFLRKQGLKYVEEDVVATRSRIASIVR